MFFVFLSLEEFFITGVHSCPYWFNSKPLGLGRICFLNGSSCLLNGHLGTNFSKFWIRIISFSFTKMHLKMSSARMVTILSRGGGGNLKHFISSVAPLFIKNGVKASNKEIIQAVDDFIMGCCFEDEVILCNRYTNSWLIMCRTQKRLCNVIRLRVRQPLYF